jgi:hypothetical protein
VVSTPHPTIRFIINFKNRRLLPPRPNKKVIKYNRGRRAK